MEMNDPARESHGFPVASAVRKGKEGKSVAGRAWRVSQGSYAIKLNVIGPRFTYILNSISQLLKPALIRKSLASFCEVSASTLLSGTSGDSSHLLTPS